MARIKTILAGGTHPAAAIRRSELSPEQPHPPRMGLAGDQDDRAVLLMSKSRAEHSDFIRGIDDRGLQHANGLRGNSLVDQDACAVNLFAFVSESHSLQSLPRLGGVQIGTASCRERV